MICIKFNVARTRLLYPKVKNMKINTEIFIEELTKDLSSVIDTVHQQIEGLDDDSLNRLEAPKKWSMLQCIAHMSIAHQVYVVNMSKALGKAVKGNSSDTFQSHWKGDMFTKMMKPKENDEIKGKMKTFKSMEPEQRLDTSQTIATFDKVHNDLLGLLKDSADYNLNSIKVPTAMGPMVKLRLGDAFRFIIAHAQRHTLQLKRIHQSIQVAA